MSKIKWFGPLVVVVLLALTMGSPTLSGKGKPGGGGGGGTTPTGIVYFLSGGDPYVMDADGNNIQALPLNTTGFPSVETHGGYTWFLRLQPVAGTYPNGDPRMDLVAVREDGAATAVLISDPLFQPLETSPYFSERSFRWATDNNVIDGKISFGARLWDVGGFVVEQGVYQSPVGFDGSGAIMGSGPPELLFIVNDTPSEANDNLDIADHSWSPDGTMLAFTTRAASDLYVMDVITGNTSLLVSFVQFPAWSPNGTIIAFTSNDGLETIDLANLDRTLHVETIVRKNSVTAPRGPTWLPGGDHIVYDDYNFDRKSWSGSNNVRRLNLLDGSDIALTSDGVSTVVESR
jgi:hypothetical protein